MNPDGRFISAKAKNTSRGGKYVSQDRRYMKPDGRFTSPETGITNRGGNYDSRGWKYMNLDGRFTNLGARTTTWDYN